MRKVFTIISIIILFAVSWLFFSNKKYEFLYPKAYKSSAHCPEVVLNDESECYYIPDLNYKEAMDWHSDKLSSLQWKGGVTTDDSPVSFFYEKNDERIMLIFYPESSTQGNVSTFLYDQEGVGLLIKFLK